MQLLLTKEGSNGEIEKNSILGQKCSKKAMFSPKLKFIRKLKNLGYCT